MRSSRPSTAFFLALVLPVFIAAGFADPSAAAPRGEICGTVAADTTWGSDGSPWILTCKIRVEPGATLTITEGARLKLAYDVDLEVAGRLQILGTREQLVTVGSRRGEHGAMGQHLPAARQWATCHSKTPSSPAVAGPGCAPCSKCARMMR